MKTNKSLRDRLWDNVALGTKEMCWIWLGCKDPKGYGRIKVGRKARLPHRLAYELAIGPVSDDLCVLHRCDNPSCVNPSHLFLGTKAENNADMKAKGRARAPRGERSPKAKLTAAQVAEIRQKSTGYWGEKAAIAREYGVDETTIGAILRNEAWVPYPAAPEMT